MKTTLCPKEREGVRSVASSIGKLYRTNCLSFPPFLGIDDSFMHSILGSISGLQKGGARRRKERKSTLYKPVAPIAFPAY